MGLRGVGYSAGEKIKLCRLLSFSDYGVSVWGQFNYEYFIIIINYPYGGRPWTKKLYTFLQRTQTVKGSHFKACSKSEFSHVCYAYCQEYIPQRNTVDAEIKVIAVENLELTNILPLRPGAGWNIVTHASTTARNSLLVLHPIFCILSPLFFRSSPYFSTVLFLVNGGLQNEIGCPAISHK